MINKQCLTIAMVVSLIIFWRRYWIYGSAGDDQLISGNEGDDIIYGNDGCDHLLGDEGSDWLYGGRDSDWIFGGAGKDNLYGGSGTGDDEALDYFVFTDDSMGASVIHDFQSGSTSSSDIIWLQGSIGVVSNWDDNSDKFLSLSNNGTIQLVGCANKSIQIKTNDDISVISWTP